MPDTTPATSAAERVLTLRAPAKINLALEVTRKRPDGYHEIDTVLTTLDLSDRVRLSAHDGLEVVIEGIDAKAIDAADDLAGRAARAMAEAAGRAPDVRIELTKRIPVAAGLGGGSSDAAAVLRGLNVLWGLDWPPARLEAIAATLGSDVPFFVHCGTAHCTGRGEKVEPLRDLRPLRLLLMVPATAEGPGKTARRYGALTPRDFTDGHRSWRLSQRIARGAPPPTADLINPFEAAIERSDPELVAHYAALRAVGAPHLHLCGAGPTVYSLVQEDLRAAALRRDLESTGARVIEARTLGRAAALEVIEG
ncbi:MAG: 4-(cytidine 5'-diphospho)-2-C-methyl-D-erythritol kinase [Dehalococcoidia bacterium]